MAEVRFLATDVPGRAHSLFAKTAELVLPPLGIITILFS